MKTTGYQELPEWPTTAPDPSVRNVEVAPTWQENREPIRGKKQKQPSSDVKTFYSSSSDDDGKGTKLCVSFMLLFYICFVVVIFYLSIIFKC